MRRACSGTGLRATPSKKQYDWGPETSSQATTLALALTRTDVSTRLSTKFATRSEELPVQNALIPVLNVTREICDEHPCGTAVSTPTIAPSLLAVENRFVMSLAATSEAMNVLIADSNRMQAQLLTGALRRHPEFHISACPMNTVSILHAVSSKLPRVALLSFNVSGSLSEKMATLRRFHLSHPEVAKILLVESCDRDLVINAFRSGARGIFSITDSSLRLLCKCILRVADQQIWANTEQLNYIMDLISEVPSLRVLNSTGDSLLTPREEQVVALVAEGLSNRQIAAELNLSEHTIKKYVFRIFEKLGVSTRVELVLYAVNNGDPRRAAWIARDSRPLPGG